MALGVHNSINVSLQIGLVNRHEAVFLQAVIAAMLFRGVAVETSTRVIYTVMAAETAGARLVSPFCAAPPTRTFSRAASGHGIANLTKCASIGQA